MRRRSLRRPGRRPASLLHAVVVAATACSNDNLVLPSADGARLALAVQPSPTAQSGVPFAQQPRVQVQNADGRPIPQSGVIVTANISSGLGRLEGSVQETTGEDGAGQFTDLTITGSSGSRALTFSANLASVTSDPVAIGIGDPSPARSSVSVAPASIEAGTETSRITVTVRDAAGAASPGASVSLSATGGGNTVTPARVTSNANGVAEFTFSSTVAAAKQLIATANGTDLDDQPTIAVVAAATETRITRHAPDPSRIGQGVSVEVEVAGVGGGIPSGSVAVSNGSGASCTATLDTSGRGTCSLIPLAPGATTFVATYAGDSRFGGSSAEAGHQVNP